MRRAFKASPTLGLASREGVRRRGVGRGGRGGRRSPQLAVIAPKPGVPKRTGPGGLEQPQVKRCKVDFSKLRHNTLRKYLKAYGLKTVHLYSNKEDLTRAVEEHFAAQTVTEEEVVLSILRKKGDVSDEDVMVN